MYYDYIIIFVCKIIDMTSFEQILENKPHIKNRLYNLPIVELKVILDVCRECGKTNTLWKERALYIEKLLVDTVDNVLK